VLRVSCALGKIPFFEQRVRRAGGAVATLVRGNAREIGGNA
jgi:hypothetical protein